MRWETAVFIALNVVAAFGLMWCVRQWAKTPSRPAKQRPEDVIVRLLREHGELRGLDLVKLSDGALSRGSVYVHLSRLEDEGVVAVRWSRDELRGGPVGIYRLVEPRGGLALCGLCMQPLECPDDHGVGGCVDRAPEVRVDTQALTQATDAQRAAFWRYMASEADRGGYDILCPPATRIIPPPAEDR